MFFNMLFSKYSRFGVLTNHKNQKIKPNKNAFQNSYMYKYYLCNNLKKKFKSCEIEKKIPNSKKTKMFFNFHQNL